MPVDRGAIDRQLAEIGEGERWWEQREFRDLPYILHAEERIRGLSTGRLLGPRRPRLLPAARWLLVVTGERLICLRQERFGRKQVEVVAGQITGVRQRSRLHSHQITLETHRRRYRIRVPKEDAFRFVGALSSLLPDPPPRALTAGPGAPAWLPGAAGLLSKVSLLSPPDYATREHADRLEATVERLQDDVERLQQQVRFLEELLEKRAADAVLSRPQAES